MLLNEIKSVIAHNCPEYEGNHGLSMLSIGSLAESCSNCRNYEKGQCTKKLLESMKEKIERN
jgi:hypothetical protein